MTRDADFSHLQRPAPSSCLSSASKSFSDNTKPCSPGNTEKHFFLSMITVVYVVKLALA